MINYPTKFSIGQKVIITEGLYKGKTGIVSNYTPQMCAGFYELLFTKAALTGQYTVKTGWFTSLYVLEQSLASQE